MFQFRRFPSYTYLIQYMIHEYCPCVFPHSEISGSKLICSSPKLFAACHVLHRLLMPRHSPCALLRLTWNYAGFFVVSASIVVLPSGALAPIVFHNFLLPFLLPCFLLLVFFVQFSRCCLPAFLKARSQYLPLRVSIHIRPSESEWWAQVDSNHRPHDYQSCALAS